LSIGEHFHIVACECGEGGEAAADAYGQEFEQPAAIVRVSAGQAGDDAEDQATYDVYYKCLDWKTYLAAFVKKVEGEIAQRAANAAAETDKKDIPEHDELLQLIVKQIVSRSHQLFAAVVANSIAAAKIYNFADCVSRRWQNKENAKFATSKINVQ
jgi:hypothetical protein